MTRVNAPLAQNVGGDDRQQRYPVEEPDVHALRTHRGADLGANRLGIMTARICDSRHVSIRIQASTVTLSPMKHTSSSRSCVNTQNPVVGPCRQCRLSNTFRRTQKRDYTLHQEELQT